MNWKQQVEDFKHGLKVEPATIQASFIRFGFFGLVGGGKSVTGGIFALGITPAPGLIGWVDGEGHRSGWAADLVAEKAATHYGRAKADQLARFKVIHIDPPFHPLRAVAAAEALIAAGCRTVIMDLMSQLWDSDGGYLDLKNDTLDAMAGDDAGKRERSAAAAAARVKPWTHQKLVNFVTVAPVNMVMIFQGKRKFNAMAKTKIDEIETPIQESGMTRTALAVGRVEQIGGEGGFCTFSGDGTKYTDPRLRKLLPEGRQLTFADAEAIAKWARGDVSPAPAATKLATEKTRSWMLGEIIKATSRETVEEFAAVTGLISDQQGIEEWPLDKVPTDKTGLAELIQRIKTVG